MISTDEQETIHHSALVSYFSQRRKYFHETLTKTLCPFRGCMGPEIAVGDHITVVTDAMKTYRCKFKSKFCSVT